jgi:DNA-binding transcriptional LysR family regulator
MEQSIDLTHVEIFLKVAECRSFTASAKTLGIPKSKVSRAISHLEADMKSQLFYRNTRQVELTALGQVLYANCRESMLSLQAGIKRTLEQSQELEGVIRVTAVVDVGAMLLAPIIAKFSERYPKLCFDLVLTSEVVDLIAQSVDVAVRVGQVKQQSFRLRRVGNIRFILVATSRYLERFNKRPTVQELGDADFIVYSGFEAKKKGIELIRGEEKIRIEASVKFQSTDTATMLKLVKSGVGVGLLPDFLCADGLRKESLIPVCKGWHTKARQVSIITPAHKKESAAVKLFTSFLYENLNDVLS